MIPWTLVLLKDLTVSSHEIIMSPHVFLFCISTKHFFEQQSYKEVWSLLLNWAVLFVRLLEKQCFENIYYWRETLAVSHWRVADFTSTFLRPRPASSQVIALIIIRPLVVFSRCSAYLSVAQSSLTNHSFAKENDLVPDTFSTPSQQFFWAFMTVDLVMKTTMSDLCSENACWALLIILILSPQPIKSFGTAASEPYINLAVFPNFKKAANFSTIKTRTLRAPLWRGSELQVPLLRLCRSHDVQLVLRHFACPARDCYTIDWEKLTFFPGNLFTPFSDAWTFQVWKPICATDSTRAALSLRFVVCFLICWSFLQVSCAGDALKMFRRRILLVVGNTGIFLLLNGLLSAYRAQ